MHCGDKNLLDGGIPVVLVPPLWSFLWPFWSCFDENTFTKNRATHTEKKKKTPWKPTRARKNAWAPKPPEPRKNREHQNPQTPWNKMGTRKASSRAPNYPYENNIYDVVCCWVLEKVLMGRFLRWSVWKRYPKAITAQFLAELNAFTATHPEKQKKTPPKSLLIITKP